MRGLAARILPRVVIPTLVAGTLFGAGDWYLSRHATLDKAQAELVEVGRAAAGFVIEDLKGPEHVGDLLLQLEEKQGGSLQSRESAAAQLLSARPEIQAFELFNEAGRRLFATGKTSRGPVNVAGARWFKESSKGTTWRVDPEGDELRLSRRQEPSQGASVVSILIPTQSVMARGSALLEAWRAGSSAKVQWSPLSPEDLANSADVIAVSQPLGSLEASLVVSAGTSDLLRELRGEKLTASSLLAGLFVGLAWLLVRLMHRMVLVPIDKLMELAGAFAQGEELPPKLHGEAAEICSLERTLRRAAQKSRSSAVALAGMNQELEERVQTRTQDLERIRDQALEASRAKSQFLANMSHEIRTPMNGVLGMAEILGTTELSEEQQSYLDVIRRSGDGLLGVINDILDFSKIEAGKIELEEVDFELVKNVHDVATLLAERAEHKGVELVFDADPRLPSHVVGDPARIRQVVTNLVGNAIKFTKEGTVQVRVRYHDIGQELVEFQVIDSGIGIPKEALASIFDSFSQADISTTRKFGGTGLGLTISRKLVELMGGELKVKSELGEGSDFSFVLKMGVSRQASNANTAAELLAGRRVLIVDDNRSNRRIFARQFKAIGVETVCVEGGLEAIQEVNEDWADGRRFDFAVLDYQMPHMSGVELADRLAPMCEKSGMQLVLLSSALVLERGKKGSLARRLTKPVRADLLFSTLAGLLPEGAQPLEVPAPLPTPKKKPLSKEVAHRILLAEDNRVNQLVATKLLEALGFGVDLAENGKEALEMATKRDYPAILMDCQMPIMDGYQATAEIKHLLPDLPIIAMTANAMEGDREKCLAAGMDDYVTKPIKKGVLVEVLQRHMASLPRT